MEQIRAGTGISGSRIGLVVNNNDPLEIQRVQVRISQMHQGVSDLDLPWAFPRNSNGVGHYNGASFQNVPLQGSLVEIEFQNGDPHMPVYLSKVLTPDRKSSVLTTNYPNRYGWVLGNGAHFYIDQKTGDVEFSTPSGTTFHIDPSGNVTLTVAGNLNSSAKQWNHTGPMTLNGNMDVVGNLIITGGTLSMA